MELITIIIPVYNTEKYLARCIESIKRQTYTNWELLLIDDGSTDGSGEICDSYQRKDNRIRVVHNKNYGPAFSRADGIAKAEGNLIMFVDSDDWLDENMLQMMWEQLTVTKCNMVCCFFKNIDDKGKVKHTQLFKEDYIDCYTAEECMYQMHHTRYLTGSPCTKLYRKELFAGLDFCKDVTIGEDYAMIIQLSQKAQRVRIISKELYYRYVRRGSISHGGYTDRHKKAFDNYMQIREQLMGKYPSLKSDIIAFHTEYEMAVITAMCRNDCYDSVVIDKLKMDLRQNMWNTLRHPLIPLYMKGCAVLIAYAHPIFIFLFRILYHWTGR